MLDIPKIKKMMLEYWIIQARHEGKMYDKNEIGSLGGGLRPPVYKGQPETPEDQRRIESLRSGLKEMHHSKVSNSSLEEVIEMMWDYAGPAATLMKPFVKGDDLMELLTYYLSSFEPVFSCITIGDEGTLGSDPWRTINFKDIDRHKEGEYECVHYDDEDKQEFWDSIKDEE